jgi:hypothetical protein
MSEAGRRLPEVGTFSADGSRRWDGKFWAPQRTDHSLDEFPPPVVRPVLDDLWSERRGFGLGGVILAAAVALVISYAPIPGPNPGSLDAALTELAIVTQLRVLFTFASLVVILSVRRQGIDVLLLRAMLTAFILGVAFIGLILSPFLVFPIPVTPRVPWPVVVVAAGLIWAVLLGPFIAVFAALANLLWYRSFRSLRPQLGVFNRGSKGV